jgi:general stress protein YciG
METATNNATTSSDTAKSNRGFASMSSDRQREIARKGGRAAHAKGTAHEFTTDEARAAGQKGGQRVSTNREHMSRIGRIGGKRSAGRRQESKGAGGSNSPDGGGPSGRQPGQDAATGLDSSQVQEPQSSLSDSESSESAA